MNKLLIIFLLLFISCSKKNENEAKYNPAINKPVLSSDKTIVTFPPTSEGLKQFEISNIGTKGQFISVIAPSRAIAAIFYKKKNLDKVVLESPELNELYYNYAQSVENRKNLERNYKRLEEMAKQQAATIKELKDGERDLLNSKFSELEALNKLKASGFNPETIKKIKESSIMLVSDVPENQMGQVEMNEEVDIYFNSFPQKKFVGKVVGVGDIIDPVSRSLKIVTLLPNIDEKIRPGMFAKIEFGDFNHDVISVPITSVFTVDGKSYVFVALENNVFKLQEVGLSAYGAENVGILSGLEAGGRVVTQGTLLLKRIVFGH